MQGLSPIVSTSEQISEIEDIILFHLFKADTKSKYGFENITYLSSRYGLGIGLDELKTLCIKLGAERKLNWNDSHGSLEVQLLPAGDTYVRDIILPLTINQQKVPFEKLSSLLKEVDRLDNFELIDEDNKESIRINYTPKGKHTENYIIIGRIKFLFFSISSNPEVQVEKKKEFESVIKAFQKWINLLEESTAIPTTSATSTSNPTFEKDNFTKNSNVKLQLDSISKIDLLGRKPFVKAIADYVSRLWEEQEEHAYTIHLSGEWGSGKSNILKFLASDLESKGWYVLHYNAWEYQHIETPWWMFLNKIYKQLRTKLGFFSNKWFWFKEFCWRLIWINKLSWISFLFMLCVAIIFWSITFRAPGTKQNEINWPSVLGTILTTGGSLWLLFKSISGSLLPASDESAQNFQKNINDPVELIKNHFQSMVKYPKKNIAIFIDDIDRCNSKNVVKLLEGIQTIFKSTKVLYIFAGDAGWVRRCFEIEYNDFNENFNKPGRTLGNFFVEKVFQMTITIPVITQETIKSFLKHALSSFEAASDISKPGEAITSDFKNARNEAEIEKALVKYRGTENERIAIQTAIETISSDKTIKDIEHELESYYNLLPGNIRSIKRFINNYAIARQTLLLQGVSFSDIPMEILVRWLILSSQYPMLAEDLIKSPSLINSLSSSFKDSSESANFQNLTKNLLTEDKIKLIVGK